MFVKGVKAFHKNYISLCFDKGGLEDSFVQPNFLVTKGHSKTYPFFYV